MATKPPTKSKRPGDLAQMARTIVLEAGGESPQTTPPTKDPAASGLGRRGGLARKEKLSPSRRKEIATQAAKARWAGRE